MSQAKNVLLVLRLWREERIGSVTHLLTRRRGGEKAEFCELETGKRLSCLCFVERHRRGERKERGEKRSILRFFVNGGEKR